MLNNSEFRPQLLDYLPALYRRSKQLNSFLSLFQATLFGPDIEKSENGGLTSRKSVQTLIREIPALFDPEQAPPDFLPWLAQWAALSSHEGLPESRRRQLIGQMIPLYAIRGTKAYLERLLGLYTGGRAAVEELDLPSMQVGVRSNIGRDTRLGEDPFQFRVSLTFESVPVSREERLPLLDLARVVIDLAKPAHTHYQLVHNLTDEKLGLIIYTRSTLGVDTRL